MITYLINLLLTFMPNTHAELVIKAEEGIIDRYITLLIGKNYKIAEFVREAIDLRDAEDRMKVFNKIKEDYISEDVERNVSYISAYTKLLYITRSVRKVMNAKLSVVEKEDREREGNLPLTADFFEYVLGKMAEQKVKPEDAQKFFDSNAIAMFSLTAHPTNPTSVEFTRLLNEFEKLYADGASLDEVLLKILDTSPLQGKKTTFEEMEETIITLDSIYKGVWPLKQNLLKALAKYPEYEKYIDADKVLVKPSVWACGDGDGNPNANIEALQNGIAALKEEIKNRYFAELYGLGLSEIAKDLERGKYQTPEELLQDIKNSQADTAELECIIKTFGFNYATIDIRHNAEDLTKTFKAIAEKAGINLTEQDDYYEKLLSDTEVINKLSAVKPEDLEDAVAKRIWGRLLVAAQHPDMCTKLIIAENKTCINVLTTMLLLRASGHKISEKGAQIDIVTLSESVEDLESMDHLIEALLRSPTYRKHLAERGYIMPMIAKSDTTRRSGRGAEIMQANAIGEIYASIHNFINVKYPELKGIKVCIFNGGGAALQRGGGRMTEVAHVHGIAARMLSELGVIENTGPSTLTIQGHQCELLFSPQAENSLEAFVSQNWYAAMQNIGLLKAREVLSNEKVDLSIDQFYGISQIWLKTYRKLIGNPDNREEEPGNPSFNILYENAPWLSIILGNLSSRPAKRGGKNPGENPTVLAIKGEHPRLLDNRAITVERLTAHSGLFTITYLGMLEGLVCNWVDLHEIYVDSKLFRDAMRTTAIALFLMDFEHAWRMLCGEGRPDLKTLIVLANAFESRKYDPDESKVDDKSTLAWLEITALKTAICVQKAILDEVDLDVPENLALEQQEKFLWEKLEVYLLNNPKFSLKTVLQKAYLDLAKQLAYREGLSEFARFMEANTTVIINRPDSLNKELTPEFINFLKCVYQAADLTNAPEASLAMELTRKVDKAPLSRKSSEESLGRLYQAMSSSSSSTILPTLITTAPIAYNDNEEKSNYRDENAQVKTYEVPRGFHSWGAAI
jgi:phosphoenolpyruvate carboxylase